MALEAKSVTYRVLARSLREALEVGEYDGTRLPTEAELAALHGVSRQTVRRAMQELVTDGLIYRIPGRGTFATDRSERYLRHFGSIEDLMSLSLDTEARIVEPLTWQVNVNAAGRLRLSDDSVYALSFVRLHDEATFCVTEVALPPDVGELLRDVPELSTAGSRSRITVIGLLDARLPSPFREAEQSVTATGAPAQIAELLGCAPGAPVMRIDRTYLDETGRPVELAVSHFHPHRYSYRVKLRRQPN